MKQWDVNFEGYIRMSNDTEPSDEEIMEYVKQNMEDLLNSLEVVAASEAA